MDKICNAILETKLELLESKKSYQEEISTLYKGTIRTKRIGSNDYFYVETTEKRKPISKYLGKDKSCLPEAIRQLERRKHIKEELKRIELDLKTIEKFQALADKHLEKNKDSLISPPAGSELSSPSTKIQI